MSSTLLRLGLWLFVIVLGVYVLTETQPDSTFAEMIDLSLLTKLMGVGVLLIIAGIVAKMFEKTASVVSKNRCQVCRTPIPHGAIYCRQHLRNILHEEDDRTHMTRIRRGQ